MSVCDRCGDELPEPPVPNAIEASVVITEFERAINTTPERRERLIDAKLDNLRASLRLAMETHR